MFYALYVAACMCRAPCAHCQASRIGDLLKLAQRLLGKMMSAAMPSTAVADTPPLWHGGGSPDGRSWGRARLQPGGWRAACGNISAVPHALLQPALWLRHVVLMAPPRVSLLCRHMKPCE